MALKPRLLSTTLIASLSLALPVSTALAFDIRDSGDTPQTTSVDTASSSADLNDDGAHELASTGSILIDGTPTNDSSAIIVNSPDGTVIIDGPIVIRSHKDDGTATDTALTAATGVKITGADNGRTIRIKNDASIVIVEGISATDRRGPDYDANEDGFADNDSDEDGISEGSHALSGKNWRVGFWKVGAVSTDIIGEAGSSITIYGNGERDDPVLGNRRYASGVVISDSNLNGNLDLSTTISMFGDETHAVDILSQITGYYRQRGDFSGQTAEVDVRGEGSVGLNIAAPIGGALLLESGINATGFSTYSGSGGPSHSRDESELTVDQIAANTAERRRGGAAVNIASDVNGGVIIGGTINRVETDAETTALSAISEARADDDDDANTGTDVTAQKTLPYHYDQNRNFVARLTSHGEADNMATLRINGEVGNDGAVETLLDTTNDDGLSGTDQYRDGLTQFFYSHGLMNRGTILADGLYNDFKADAVRIDTGATINGGIFNSGTIQARANNANARAIIINGGTLTEGLRTDSSVFLNEGTIQAEVSAHTGADADATTTTYSATAISLAADSILTASATPVFVNRGAVAATSTFITAATADAARTTEAGDNATAFDFSNYTGALNLTQEFLKADALLNPGSANSASNPYLGSGDTNIDVDADGVIDTDDYARLPVIVGDVKFGNGNNAFTIKVGSVTGDISFGNGDDALLLSNEIAGDTENTTSFTGRLTKGTGGLDITVDERAQLHLIGQEGDADTETENLAVDELTVNGELRFSVDTEQLTDAVLDVTTLSLADTATITPRLTSLFAVGGSSTAKLMNYTNITRNNDIQTYLADETPYIYDVTLNDENSAISASFSYKTAADLGLNASEAQSLAAMLTHFNDDGLREAALIAIQSEATFNDAYDDLLPHYSDGTAQQLSSLADMATGAVSQHLQLINAGGRRGGDGWVQQFGDYRWQDASTNGQRVSGTSYGIAVGYDLPVAQIDAMGLYMQLGFSAVNEKSSSTNEVTSESITYGAYISDELGPLRYEVNAAFGLVDMESDRLILFNGLNDRVRASWDATSTAASARLAYPILNDQHLLRIEAGTDFFRLEHDDYAENEIVGRGFAMQVKGGESEKTSQFVGLRGGYRRGDEADPVSIVWEPNYYLGWRTTNDFTPYAARANFIGTDTAFDLKSHIEPEDALDLSLGLAAHNDYFAFELNYRARIADDEETHGGGVSIRLLF